MTLLQRAIPTPFPWKQLLLGSAVSLILLWFLSRLAAWHDVIRIMRSADVRFLSLALLAVLVSPFVRAWRWRLLFYPEHYDLEYMRLLRALLVGQMANIIVPAKAGELLRIQVLASSEGRSRLLVLGTIVLEKWLDLMFQLLLSIVVLFIIPAPSWFHDTRLTLGLATGLFLVAALLALRYRLQIAALAEHVIVRFPSSWHDRLRRAANSALASLNVLRSSRMRTNLLAISLVPLGLSIFVNAMVMRALDIRLSVAVSAFLLVALSVGVIVPSAPTKLGVFHLVAVLTLTLFGIASEQALSFAILLHVTIFLPPLILGGISLWWELLHPVSKIGDG